MKDDLKNKKDKEIPNPDEYWFDAKEVLDKHYKLKKRKLFFWVCGTILSAVAVFLFVYENIKPRVNTASQAKERNRGEVPFSNEENTKPHINSSERETKSTTPKWNEENLVKPQPLNSKSKVELNEKFFFENVKGNRETKMRHSKNNKNTNYETAAIINPSQIEKDIAVVSKEEIKIQSEKFSTSLTTSSNSKLEKETHFEFHLLQLPNYLFENITLDKPFGILTLPIENLKSTSDDYVQKNKKIVTSIGIYYGQQLVNKTLHGTNENAEYITRRTKEEQKVNTSFYGMKLAIQKNNFQLQTGIECNTFSEKNNYKPETKQWQVSDLSKWNTHTSQMLKVDTIYRFGIVTYSSRYVNIKDSVYQTQYDSVFANKSNNEVLKANGKTTIRSIEIPLMIGYEIHTGKFSIVPSVGISVGYLFLKKGMYLNQTLTGIENISSKNDIKQFVFNYNLKFQMVYAITRKFSVFISPQYKANIFTVSKKSSGVTTFYKTYGGLIGTNIKF